jgi:hypothetical protein
MEKSKDAEVCEIHRDQHRYELAHKMDKTLRNSIGKMTLAVRRLLEEEYAQQLEGTFDILPDGTINSKPGSHLDAEQRLTREKLVAAIEHKRAGGMGDEDSVNAYLREAAFTTLNRFAGLKMAESRGIVLECVSKGDQSAGFKEFGGLAPGLVALPDHGYRMYLECIFDELSVELGVLFDRRDPASLLWPRRKALDDLLDLLNAEELKSIWAEDETIGWIYQFFNGDDKKAMRDASSAPRNSRELAVRNQFFTPRYVVEFLSDNTLGRIWYEMRRGDTKLKDQCRYMVRRPTEVFLNEAEEAPDSDAEKDAELSQEGLLKQPVYIPFRPTKDPREIRVLDPACGSGHFLLYCFELLETIYTESWEDPDLGSILQADFQSLEDYRRLIPVMILEHNLHGIEIDSRCAQIASLALWLRVKKAYQQMGVVTADRPVVRKSNIVVAESMPGEKNLLKEFAHSIDPPLLGQILEKVWDTMNLAGETGYLLRVEEQIEDLVGKAKKRWKTMPKHEQMALFEPIVLNGVKTIQTELEIDTTGISDDDFWIQAEDRIYAALRHYSERASSGGGVTQKLFAENAVSGFAFIDLCRKHYDAVLMNPPFGEPSIPSRNYLYSKYKSSKMDVFAAFVDRGMEVGDAVGVITSRTCFFLAGFEAWRHRFIDGGKRLCTLADLGDGVLDAMVEAAAYCLLGGVQSSANFIRATESENKEEVVLEGCKAISRSLRNEHTFCSTFSNFGCVPTQPFAYWLSPSESRLFDTIDGLYPRWGSVVRGPEVCDLYRAARCWWEVAPTTIGADKRWVWYAKGGEFKRFAHDVHLVVDFAGARTGSCSFRRPGDSDYYFLSGLTFTQRTTKPVSFRILPKGCLTSPKGPAILPAEPAMSLSLLGLVNTRLFSGLVNSRVGAAGAAARSYDLDIIRRIPLPDPMNSVHAAIAASTKDVLFVGMRENQQDETCANFVSSVFTSDGVSRLTEFYENAVDRAEESQAIYDRSLSRIEELAGDAYDIDEVADQSARDELVFVMPKHKELIGKVLSECLGHIYGRWDIRYANGQRLLPELPEPFDPLPTSPPGMLQNAQGQPAESRDVPSDYPIRISWNAILVCDESHPEDILGRVRESLAGIWMDRAEVIEQEACELLGMKSLREYFAVSKHFFDEHIKRYSKSRRKAPIYWMLAPPSAGYAVWLYYHRFNKDTFYRVLNDFVEPKVKHEERKLNGLRQEHGPTPTASQRKEIDAQESFIAELSSFREEIARIAPLWNPDLNDGVIINYAPLWRLVPQHKSWQKECKSCWDKLVKGEYDWAHLAMHLWPERVVPNCAKDRSLAIAHGLDKVFWVEDSKGKHKAKKVPKETVEALIQEHTSPSVKAALNSLLSAPTPAGGGKSKRAGGGRKKRASKSDNMSLEL